MHKGSTLKLTATPVTNPLSLSCICIIQGKHIFLPENCSIMSTLFLYQYRGTGELFPRKCFLKDILLNRNFQKPHAFCELAIASVNFPARVHYMYRRCREFTLCCTAAMPSSSNLFFSILSSSRCCWSFANSRIRSFSSSISLRSCSFHWKVKYRQQRNEPLNTRLPSRWSTRQ